MPQTKTRSKNSKKIAAPKAAHPEEEVVGAEVPFLAKKISKEIELEVDEVLPVVAEKLDPDKLEELSPFGENSIEEDSGDEEVGLDDEELNPFGDKWEV